MANIYEEHVKIEHLFFARPSYFRNNVRARLLKSCHMLDFCKDARICYRVYRGRFTKKCSSTNKYQCFLLEQLSIT